MGGRDYDDASLSQAAILPWATYTLLTGSDERGKHHTSIPNSTVENYQKIKCNLGKFPIAISQNWNFFMVKDLVFEHFNFPLCSSSWLFSQKSVRH